MEWDQTVVRVGNSVIDLAARQVVQTIAAGVTGANRLKFTPDGALVFVSTLRGPDVTVLRAATREVVKRVPVGRGAAAAFARRIIGCYRLDDGPWRADTVAAFTDAVERDKPSQVTRAVRARRVACAPRGRP
jgi:hypothetical protein